VTEAHPLQVTWYAISEFEVLIFLGRIELLIDLVSDCISEPFFFSFLGRRNPNFITELIGFLKVLDVGSHFHFICEIALNDKNISVNSF